MLPKDHNLCEINYQWSKFEILGKGVKVDYDNLKKIVNKEKIVKYCKNEDAYLDVDQRWGWEEDYSLAQEHFNGVFLY